MQVKKKLSKAQLITKRIVCFILALITVFVVFYELTIEDRIELAIIAQIEAVSNGAINCAVSDYLLENKSVCDELINLSLDSSNQVRAISEDIYNVNIFKTGITEKSQNYIDKTMLNDGIDVKLGNFTGLNILSNWGPYVNLNIESTSTVTCDILSSFESSGVNQTLHHIELEVFVDIYVGNPIRIESIQFSTKYEIAQTLIVGNIPSAYGTISRY